MSFSMQAVGRQLLPPAFLGVARWVRGLSGRGLRFSGDYADWQAALDDSSGYDATEILARVQAATARVVAGEAAYERDGVLFDDIPKSFPLFATLLRAASESGSENESENRSALTVLDFGGSLGSSYRQCRDFLSVVSGLRWYVVEQEHFVACGRERFETEELRFFQSPDEAVSAAGGHVDVVLLSSVLHYLAEPYSTLEELSAIGSRYLIIDTTPFSRDDKDRLVVQHVPPSIYPASYPCWIFSRRSFMAAVEPVWDVVADFEATDGRWMTGRGSFEFRGMILRRRD